MPPRGLKFARGAKLSKFEELSEEGSLPEVSILVPIRNEEDYISRCLDSLIENDYPSEKVEILVIDGCSTDQSREVVKSYCKGESTDVRLLDNPEKIVPTAMNIGLEEATGEVIIRVDGHSFVDRDFISTSVRTLIENEAEAVGGPVRPVLEESSSYIQQAISAALKSPVASGSARFSGTSGYVTTVSFGAYWADVFEEYGDFDERFVRAQDYELNYRMVNSGGKIYMNPEITSYYYPRSSLRDLWSQYFQFGFWKTMIIKKYKKLLYGGNLIPPFFVLILLASCLTAIFDRRALYAVFSLLGSYGLFLVYFGYRAAVQSDEKSTHIFGIIPALATIHFSFGLGFLKGVVFDIDGKLSPPWQGL